MSIEEKRKSRDIPLMDYYGILQLEFLSYYFRMLIYDESFKSKYVDFCNKKKETIQSLSLRRGLPNIFKDEDYRIKYLKKFFHNDGFGLPNFQYRDEHQRIHHGFWDKKGYFKEGVPVTYQGKIWTIERNICYFDDPARNFVIIHQEGKPTLKVKIDELKREWNFEEIDLKC